jgi:hypothetical protein
MIVALSFGAKVFLLSALIVVCLVCAAACLSYGISSWNR